MSDMKDSLFSFERTAIASDMQELIGIEEVDNFSVLLNRCVHYFRRESNKDVDHVLKKLEEMVLKDSPKPYFFIKDEFDITQNWHPSSLKKYLLFRRNAEQKIQYLYGTEHMKEIQAHISWRLAIGLGGGSVFENGLTLDHIYGVPFIPSSSVKGVALRAFKSFGQEALAFEEAIFGSMNQEGLVTFFDVYPVEIKQHMISPDIINNHYQPYYEKGESPSDWHSPNPVLFLTVKDITFKFQLAISDEKNKNLLDLAHQSLSLALVELGIGAKTAVGYGLFKILSDEK